RRIGQRVLHVDLLSRGLGLQAGHSSALQIVKLWRFAIESALGAAALVSGITRRLCSCALLIIVAVVVAGSALADPQSAVLALLEAAAAHPCAHRTSCEYRRWWIRTEAGALEHRCVAAGA